MVDMNKIKKRMIKMMRKIKRHFYLHDDVDVLMEEIFALHVQMADVYAINDYQAKELEAMDREMAALAFDLMCNMQVPMVMALARGKSARYDRVKQWYNKGFWDVAMVEMAVQAGWITQEEYEEIING